MLINIYRSNFISGAEFNDLPYFNTHKLNVGVSQLVIEFENKIPAGLITVCSTLVDLNSANPKQQICTFFHDGQSRFAVYQPTRLVYYKMNCCNSFDAFTKIQLAEERKIKKIYLQLDICSDARFQ